MVHINAGPLSPLPLLDRVRRGLVGSRYLGTQLDSEYTSVTRSSAFTESEESLSSSCQPFKLLLASLSHPNIPLCLTKLALEAHACRARAVFSALVIWLSGYLGRRFFSAIRLRLTRACRSAFWLLGQVGARPVHSPAPPPQGPPRSPPSPRPARPGFM